MKKISEHLEVYLIQKESFFSILGRISVNAIVFLSPLALMLDDYLLYFLYKWLFVLILIYHIVYGINKLLISYLGASGFFFLSLVILLCLEGFHEEACSLVFYYLLGFHIGAGVGNVVSDYTLSDLDELIFFDFHEFNMFLSYFFSLYLGVFLFFWYF